jgi:REase_DpnII-MboI
MDFLVKDHGIVVETKMTRKGLAAKEVSEELIVDVAKYRQHQDCRTLVCLVYDPGDFSPRRQALSLIDILFFTLAGHPVRCAASRIR